MIFTAQYWPNNYQPLRQGALVTVLSVEDQWYQVKGFDGSTWLARRDELEPKASKEEDDEV